MFDTPAPILPKYVTLDVNADVLLYKGSASLETEGDSIATIGQCQLALQWLPAPRVRMGFDSNNEPNRPDAFFRSFGSISKPHTLTLISNSVRVPVLVTNIGGGEHETEGVVNGQLCIRTNEEAKRVRFHLVNFRTYHGAPIGHSNGAGQKSWAGRLSLKCDDFLITLDAIEDVDELLKKAKRTRGYVISHVGLVERIDGKSIEPKQWDTIQTCLRWFLAFADARWCGPMLAVGEDALGVEIWEDLSDYLIDPFGSGRNWASHLHRESLESLWPLFYTSWKDVASQDVLQRAIWWYVSVDQQKARTDGSLILAFAAIELLAWAHFVEIGKIVSTDGFDNLRSADKLRLFVNYIGLGDSFGPKSAEIEKLARKNNWTNAPWAITEVRNRLVHPKGREKIDGNGHALFEALEIAIQYIELGILKMIGYKGKFTNRLVANFAGETEFVPWGVAKTK